MSWLIRCSILFFAINSILFPRVAQSQDLSKVVDFADLQYSSGNFEIAANEYNRAVFFGHPQQDQLFLKIANCYFNLNNLELSKVFFDKAYFTTKFDSIKNEAILGRSFSLIMEDQWMLALSELLNFDSIQYNHQTAKMHFLTGLAYFGLHEDELAESAFKNCGHYLSDGNQDAVIEKEFALIKKNERRFNPKTAWTLSIILPGLGQLYSKEYKEAVNSAALLGGLFYLTATFAARASVLEALVVMFPWVQRYYIGGSNKSEKLALDHQLYLRNQSYLSILNYLEAEKVKSPKIIH